MHINKYVSLSLIFLMILTVLFYPAITVMADENTVTDDTDSEDEEIAAIDHITSKAAIVIDFATDLVIFELNADEPRVPASMTKMIAVYVVLDAVRDGIVKFETNLITSESVSIFSYVRAYTNVPMPPYSTYTVRKLLEAVIVRSACAATIALGEGIFGSEEAFVDRMNKKAEQLGIKAEFHDSWGGSPENKISARGMAEMTLSLIKEHPVVLEFTSMTSVNFNGVYYNSTNILLGDYEGIDGLKTGFTNPAGWCFTGTAIREGHRIISVTMGSVQGHRFSDTVALMDYGFSNYGSVIAKYFLAAIQQEESNNVNNPLVPVMMFNITKARSLGIRELALILNNT